MKSDLRLLAAELCEQAAALDAAERDAFVAEVSGANVELRKELLEMLARRSRPHAIDRPLKLVNSLIAILPPTQPMDELHGEKAARMAKVAHMLQAKYVIEREIGSGGMATVYLAQDIKHRRQVAIKVIGDKQAADTAAARFRREVMTTAQLDHPNIVPLFDSGEEDGLLYYVMPFVEGESLRDRLARDKLLPHEEAVRIAKVIANALQYAHAHGVIHRDIKPANILLKSELVLVADFGIARTVTEGDEHDLTRPGFVLGTPTYMSPEQRRGATNIDARTDIYSLGVVTYEMLTGERTSVDQLQGGVGHARRLPRQCPPHVADAIIRAMAPNAADRFDTADDFARALDAPPAVVAQGTASKKAGLALGGWVAAAIAVLLAALPLSRGWHARGGEGGPPSEPNAPSSQDSTSSGGPAPEPRPPNPEPKKLLKPPPPKPDPGPSPDAGGSAPSPAPNPPTSATTADAEMRALPVSMIGYASSRWKQATILVDSVEVGDLNDPLSEQYGLHFLIPMQPHSGEQVSEFLQRERLFELRLAGRRACTVRRPIRSTSDTVRFTGLGCYP